MVCRHLVSEWKFDSPAHGHNARTQRCMHSSVTSRGRVQSGPAIWTRKVMSPIAPLQSRRATNLYGRATNSRLHSQHDTHGRPSADSQGLAGHARKPGRTRPGPHFHRQGDLGRKKKVQAAFKNEKLDWWKVELKIHYKIGLSKRRHKKHLKQYVNRSNTGAMLYNARIDKQQFLKISDISLKKHNF